ncbi:hypothetical protein Tco_0109833 [Tanacetum coccineum]
MVDEFAPPKFFASIRGMEHDHLFTKFNVGATHQMSLSAEVRMRVEYNVKEKRRLKSIVERQGELLKVGEGEIESLKAQLALKEAEAAEAIRLHLEASAVRKKCELTDLNSLITYVKSHNDNLMDWVHKLEIYSFGLQEKVTVYENCIEQLEKFQDDWMKVVDGVVWHLDVDSSHPGMALHVEEKFYPYLLTTISGRRWLLTQDMELTIIKCLNLPEYVSALGAPIGKAIEKGMQDGLSTGITHGKEGRVLTDLKSNKDASIEVVVDILRLEGPLADKLGLDELQPNVDRLMVPIHHSPNKVVIGATALSALRDVLVPLSKPFSNAVLTGMGGTYDIMSITADTTTTLSITFASASLIALIFVDDYEVIGAYDQAVTDGNAASFPNVDDAELNIVQ